MTPNDKRSYTSTDPADVIAHQEIESQDDSAILSADRAPELRTKGEYGSPPKRSRDQGEGEPPYALQLYRDSRSPLSIFRFTPVLFVILFIGSLLLAAGVYSRAVYGERWWALFLREAGAVLMVVAVVHAIYEIVIHKVLHDDIIRLGVTVEALQRTVSIVGGAVESGLAAVYASRDEVNRAMAEEISKMGPGTTLKMLGISLGAFLCPHGALHSAFRKLLIRDDVTIDALILDIESAAAVDRARLEEPRSFAAGLRAGEDQRTAFKSTRCHNELKTATDFAQDLADRCYYRDVVNIASESAPYDAPSEPAVNAKFVYRVYAAAPLCYLVIFQDYMFLENYHDAGRGGEAPVLKIGRFSGESGDTTSLFRIYENHFEVVKSFSRDRAKDLHTARARDGGGEK